jgi:hypothetical protein
MAVVIVFDTGIMRAMQTDGKGWNQKVAREVQEEAELICPVGGGVLKAKHGHTQNRLNGSFSTGFNVYNDARHALWVHNGTGVYGPTGMPIRPRWTEKLTYLHMPVGFQPAWYWTHVKKGDWDPFGHKEEVDGSRGNPWLRRAGEAVARRHG